MTVRFVCASPEISVEYGWGDARVPCKGEKVYADGSDPHVRGGIYEVYDVLWSVGLGRAHEVTVTLEAWDPQAPR